MALQSQLSQLSLQMRVSARLITQRNNLINVNIYKLADNLIIIIPTAEGKVTLVYNIFSDCAVLSTDWTALLYEILNDYNLY